MSTHKCLIVVFDLSNKWISPVDISTVFFQVTFTCLCEQIEEIILMIMPLRSQRHDRVEFLIHEGRGTKKSAWNAERCQTMAFELTFVKQYFRVRSLSFAERCEKFYRIKRSHFLLRTGNKMPGARFQREPVRHSRRRNSGGALSFLLLLLLLHILFNQLDGWSSLSREVLMTFSSSCTYERLLPFIILIENKTIRERERERKSETA